MPSDPTVPSPGHDRDASGRERSELDSPAAVSAELQALRAANAELQQRLASVESVELAVIRVDAALRIAAYTPVACELFNLIPSDVGRPLMHVTHRFDYDELHHDARQALRGGRRVDREIRADDGRHFIARLQPLAADAADAVAGLAISFIDISELRASQEDTSGAAAQLYLAAESTTDFAILTTDAAGTICGWNLGAERIFGYARHEVMGQHYAIIFTDEDRAAGVPELELAQARAIGRGEDERWHRRKSGSVFYCSGATTRLDGNSGFAKIARDVTRSQQSALARERLLSREQKDRREVQATMEAKELFLAVMSHELKHPLNLIHLNAELLARMPEVRLLPVAARAAHIIQQTVAGQARIVDDLLDLSRARTGKLKLDRAPVDWTETVRRIVEAMRPVALAKGVKLLFDSQASTTLTLFDPVRAEQVVWNLLSNALKFTPPDGSVRVLLVAEDGQARLTVTDTGRGIHSAFIDQVFEMFSQEPGPNRPVEGMGIGLALVRELVQAHGGRVEARSEGPGRGAEFSVWIPLYTGEPAAPPPSGQSSVLGGLHMLVVDDSADTADTLSMLLEISGAHVSRAYNGQDALALLARQPFDVLVSDVSMPGMSGHELVADVRAGERGQDREPLLALACSGYGRAQDERHAIEAGFDALLPKPVPLEQLERTVERLLARRRLAASGLHGAAGPQPG